MEGNLLYVDLRYPLLHTGFIANLTSRLTVVYNNYTDNNVSSKQINTNVEMSKIGVDMEKATQTLNIILAHH